MTSQPHGVFGAEGPTGRVTGSDVAHAIRRLSLRSQDYTEAVGHHMQVHRTDLAALNVISLAEGRGESMTPSELARSLSMSAAAMTALVDRLVKVGHLERHPDPKDRRRTHLRVTPTASVTGRAMFAPMAEQIRQAAEAYSPEELALVVKVLADIEAAINHDGVADVPLEPRVSDHEPG
ncbi:MarR family transcriptional regulator [Ornithinimicrobium sp. Arc0846-15]|nr:MarR family transcriptional regulator [Ornithinimicrobium laminariae]